MAKEQEFSADNVMNNQMAKLDADFADTIRDLHAELSSKEGSPIYTGFLASSWKVRRFPIRDKQSVYNWSPWAGIRRQLDAVYASSKEERKRKRRALSEKIAKIKIRFPVNTAYKFTDADIHIGNAAYYAGYSAEDQKLANFIQDKAGKIIKDNMRDKGKIFLGVKPGSGFGSIKPGSSLRYIEG
tara:strand:+ start:370 stop:924 length:555 start_codon:yes stop_codon:yes gene_type:complete